MINTPAALAEVCEHLAAAKVFGFDTEFIGESSYRPVLCLVQVATDERAELIDPLAVKDLGPLWDLLADPTIEKICYAGDQDLAIAWQLGRKTPQNVFDCQIGAGLVGIGYQEAYWRLVEMVAGIKLGKAHTYSDWGRRPLSKAQLTYALDDVLYLPEIHRMLRGRLESLGRMDWMREACREVCEKAATDLDPETVFANIKGASKLNSQQLSVLRELTILREQMACEQNVPARVMLRDEALMELAATGPETEVRLSRIRSVPGPKADRYGDQIIGAVKRGKAVPADQRPYLPPIMEDSTETKQLSEIMYASSQVICLGQSVSPNLVTNQAKIQGLARLISQGQDLSGHALMSGWVRECLGAPLIDFVRGNTGLALNVKQGRMHAEFEASD
ncbi:MAG: HRDC domain-containing protein [Armatimonadia bacterium]